MVLIADQGHDVAFHLGQNDSIRVSRSHRTLQFLGCRPVRLDRVASHAKSHIPGKTSVVYFSP